MKHLHEPPRPLNATEMRLVQYGMSEREAVVLAPHVELPADATPKQIEDAVIYALVAVGEQVHGPADVRYISGQRRDVLREQSRPKYSLR
jgi:hypothetical protein